MAVVVAMRVEQPVMFVVMVVVVVMLGDLAA
jgi:hypothetical protein